MIYMSKLIKKSLGCFVNSKFGEIIPCSELEKVGEQQFYIFANSAKEIIEELKKFTNEYRKKEISDYFKMEIDKNLDKSKITPGWVVNLEFYDVAA